MPVSYTLFETSIGSMGVAWTDAGISWIQLPEETPKKTEARLRAKAPLAKRAAPPPAIVKATNAIVAHVKGDTQTFAGIKLDDSGLPPFHRHGPVDALCQPERRDPQNQTDTLRKTARHPRR